MGWALNRINLNINLNLIRQIFQMSLYTLFSEYKFYYHKLILWSTITIMGAHNRSFCTSSFMQTKQHYPNKLLSCSSFRSPSHPAPSHTEWASWPLPPWLYKSWWQQSSNAGNSIYSTGWGMDAHTLTW